MYCRNELVFTQICFIIYVKVARPYPVFFEGICGPFIWEQFGFYWWTIITRGLQIPKYGNILKKQTKQQQNNNNTNKNEEKLPCISFCNLRSLSDDGSTCKDNRMKKE